MADMVRIENVDRNEDGSTTLYGYNTRTGDPVVEVVPAGATVMRVVRAGDV